MQDRHGNPVPLTKRLDIPPLWLLGTLLLQTVVARIVPLARFDLPGGILLVGAGIALILWSASHFRTAQTPIHPRRKPTALITDGPFAFSRNPIYLGMALIALGWGWQLGTISALMMIPLFMLLIQRRFIDGEELHVGKAMGAEWDAYARHVRRWL
jgi:protein-S-isoprenylcysteine O-methyltransferase Ste14